MTMEKTILVVEDQDDLRLLIRLTLKQLGAVSAHADARDLMALVRSARPALLVLDVWLGAGINGLDLCRELKAGAAGHVPKVLLLSACGQQSDIEAGLAAGADRYVVKPFSPESLVQAAAGLLAD